MPAVTECVRFAMQPEELNSIQLEGFDDLISAYKKLVSDKFKLEEQPEMKQIKLIG